jgi:hypothetical protein
MKASRMRCAKVVACTGAMRNLYGNLVGKPDGKRPLGRPRHKFEESIEVDLEEMGRYGVERINLAQDNFRCLSCEHGNENYY